MDLLFQHIESIAPDLRDSPDNEKISEFIKGNVDFEAIRPILLKILRYGYDEDRNLRFDCQSAVTKSLVRKLALEYEDIALRTAEKSNLLTRVFLLSAFWEQSKHLNKVAMVEKEVLRALLNTNDIEGHKELKALLRGEAPQSADEHLPFLEIFVDSFAHINAMLSIVSPLPSRFSEYSIDVILSVKHMDSYLCYFHRLLSIMQEYFGENTTESFFAELNKPAHDKITLLLKLFFYFRGTYKCMLRKQILSLDDISAAEKAFERVTANERVTLMEIINESGNKKPEFLIKCLFDSSKKVRELAMEYLTPKTELREQIEELLKSKKKTVRECAEKLMAAYNSTDFPDSNNGDIEYATANQMDIVKN